MKRFLLIVLLIILIVIGAISVIARKNVASMNRCVDTVLEELNKYYTVTVLDPGEYKNLKLYGMIKFNVEQYDIEELGNLSVMRVNMGAMQMATAVITPQNKNLPLLSVDYLYILSNRKAYLEFYDVVKEKDEPYMQLMDALKAVAVNYEHLEDFEPSEAWYDSLLTAASFKSATSKSDDDLINILEDSLQVYLEHSKRIPLLSKEECAEKLSITTAYTNGLIENGGVSTDIFKKQLGVEETRKFFDTVFFGTAAK